MDLLRASPLPNTAKIGITKRKRTGIPPIKFPTKISGLFSLTAVSPTANSGVEVSIPRTKKEKANEETLNFLANLSVDATILPAPYQIMTKEPRKTRSWRMGIQLVYRS